MVFGQSLLKSVQTIQRIVLSPVSLKVNKNLRENLRKQFYFKIFQVHKYVVNNFR